MEFKLSKSSKSISNRACVVTVLRQAIPALILVFAGTVNAFQKRDYAKTNLNRPAFQARPSEPTIRSSLTSRKREDNWFTFTSPDGDFTLSFPLKPKLQDVTSGPATLIRSFAVTIEEGTTFSINFQDIGGDPNVPANNKWNRDLEEVMAAADRNQNIKVIQTHRLAKNVIEAEVLQALAESGSNINYLRRSILRRARVYTLACGPVINNKKVDRPLCERFFNSIRFTTPKPRRR